MHSSHTKEAQILDIFALQWAIFELRPNNAKKSARNDPKMTLTHSKSKYPTATTCNCEAQIFVTFTLPWTVFKLQPNFEKSAQNELEQFEVKVPI